MKHLRPLYIAISLFIAIAMAVPAPVQARQKSKPAATASSGGRQSKSSKEKTSPKKSSQRGKGTASTKGSSRKKGKTPARESSATVKKRQQSVSREIEDTRKRIEVNDVAVSTNLATLQALDHDVQLQTRRVAGLRTREQNLHLDIATCNASIARSEQRLSLMREQYVRAIKRMRAARKRTNPLAFIFSSKNFYQALRRMRYLRKFADWREKREKQIRTEIARLDAQRKQLARSQADLSATITEQEKASKLLASKQQEQAATVARLRADGQALRSHLERKQAEANALNSRVAQLIAAEQAEAAAAERRRQQEAAAKAERERLAAEKAEKDRQAAEQLRRQQEAESRELAARREKEQAEASKKQQPKKQKPKKEQPKKQPQKQQSTDEKRYADARKRKPRQPQPLANKPEEKRKSQAPTGFAAAKGALPRPVAGQFSVVSRFGRHPLPDLPEVVYDNPGIDAVVSAGASAQAVYSGTVTGVYALPGYSTVVIVCHGEYYTVYGNIGTPAVKKGDSVKAGQNLGRLVADPNEGGRTTIHFEVWKNREKQNPEAWIR